MILPSDTPPDGDFAAYIERLMGANAQAGPRENLLQPQSDTADTNDIADTADVPTSTFTLSAGLPSVKTLPDVVESMAFLVHIKWLVVVWIAIRMLDRYVLPGVGFLFIVVLLAYAGWVIFSLNRNSSGALAKQAHELAHHAQELASHALSSAKNTPKLRFSRKKKS